MRVDRLKQQQRLLELLYLCLKWLRKCRLRRRNLLDSLKRHKCHRLDVLDRTDEKMRVEREGD